MIAGGRDVGGIVAPDTKNNANRPANGQRVGRDIGIAYGLIGGIILFLVLNALTQYATLVRIFG